MKQRERERERGREDYKQLFERVKENKIRYKNRKIKSK